MRRASNPFYLNIPEKRADGSELPKILKFARRFQGILEKVSGLRTMQWHYDQLPEGLTGVAFVEESLRALNIGYEISGGSLENIPKSGPVVIVSNHPFGGIEGVILIEILSKVRPDFKVMANSLLGRVKELNDQMILVDPFGEEDSAKKNIGPVREALSYVKKGGLLAIFPSGTVSHLQLDRKEVSDPDWSETVGRIIRSTKAPVIPLFICGANGLFFQLLGLVHPLLRTAALPRELINKKNTKFRFKVGKLIPFEKLNSFKTDKKLIDYLRIRSYIQADRDFRSHLIPGIPVFIERIIERFAGRNILVPEEESPRQLEPIVKGQPASVLAEEVDLLPHDQMLLESDSNQVWYARAEQIPHIMQEIGRLREITFREVKEGTGRSIDLDTFDNYYVHLFVWNVKNQDVVGSYRMGRTDVVFDRYGAKGLYTNTLFDYRVELLDQIRPALELGRSFVRKEYQKTFSALLLLWKGIGHYVAKYPRYRYLYGPVSINNDYDSISRQLIISFLQANNYDPALAGMIRARNPLRHKRIPGVDPEVNSIVVGDVGEISELLQEIESTQKDIPVLLRQYIKLGGKLLGFNVDPSFGGVLDGLLLVDLLDTESRLLQRYLSKEGAAEFLEYHEKMGTRAKQADEPKRDAS
jgi:putative hemolysin